MVREQLTMRYLFGVKMRIDVAENSKAGTNHPGLVLRSCECGQKNPGTQPGPFAAERIPDACPQCPDYFVFAPSAAV
jgi:hypothetical protein